jgi:hypothetical protein
MVASAPSFSLAVDTNPENKTNLKSEEKIKIFAHMTLRNE